MDLYIEMINWGKSDKIIEIKGKTDKSNTCKSLVVEIFHSFIQRTSSDLTIFFCLNVEKLKKCFVWWSSWNHHHYHVALSARISLTLSLHHSPSSIASSKSWGLHPVSAQSCCMYVWAGCPAFASPCEGVHRSTSLMSSSLLLWQCPACLVHLILIVFVIGGHTAATLWGAVSRTCSILLAAFLCSSRQAYSPYILFVSIWCIHPAVSTWPLPGRNCTSFYWSGLNSIWLIAYR